MNKGLQALEDITLYLNANEPKGLYCKNIEILKTALKRLEMIDNSVHFDMEYYEKRNRALEIIKRHFKIAKPIGVSIEKNAVGVGGLIQIKDLTIEEYHILKEILL